MNIPVEEEDPIVPQQAEETPWQRGS